MSFGWLILINGIIGIVIYSVTIVPFMAWLSIKYGDNNADDSLHDLREHSDTVGFQFTKGKMDMWFMIAYFVTFFLWEIEIPLKYYLIWEHAKELHKLRDNKEEMHHE